MSDSGRSGVASSLSSSDNIYDQLINSSMAAAEFYSLVRGKVFKA
jgi:hypothetical protein